MREPGKVYRLCFVPQATCRLRERVRWVFAAFRQHWCLLQARTP
ncbi:hypothetical protein KKY_2510 [Pelagibacterium halotolerans B2]|uniref:Uncharacterized protein n=1 Tax=Pelagibacterium halotolerans (strain DSM 22347 / JCM 15775 / CGMCC 1.7692 / B2) TaxID=1082931 RepID=G4R9Z1_PELHB|nr:hypothetical protein KKY_2510 [Pelagibacterium halotolerans B2]